MKLRTIVVSAMAAVGLVSVSVAQEKASKERVIRETHIKEASGSETVVRTDRKGTTVTTDGKGVYSSGGDRHKEQVEHSTKNGGTITKEKK